MKGTLTQAQLGLRDPFRAGWRKLGMHGGRSLLAEVEAGAAASPGTRALFRSIEHPAEYTLPEALERSRRVASGLARLGLRAGDVVVSQVPHWAEGHLAFLAALRLGLVLVPVVHIYGPAELGFILRQTRARALLVPDRLRKIDFAERVAALGDLPDLEHIVVVGTGSVPGPVTHWDDMLGRADADVPTHVAADDDIVVMSYTSGTTSAPKGVMHSGRSVEAELIGTDPYVERQPPGPMLISASPGHIGGMVAMLRPFVSREDAVFVDHWEREHVAGLIRDDRIVRANFQPIHLLMLLESGADLGTLRHCMLGGSGVPPSLIEEIDRRGISGYRCWGCTEHPTVTSTLPGDQLRDRAHTDGAEMLGCTVRVVDDEGRPVKPGERGEIESMGPEMFDGYFDPAANEAAFARDGWYRSGDIAVIDERGLLTVVDRKKDIIIRGGENISSQEVEAVTARHPSVAEVAAVGFADPRFGERVGVFVRLRPGGRLDVQDLSRHFSNAGVARQKTPEYVVTLDDFPRSGTGKVLKTELRRRAAAHVEETA